MCACQSLAHFRPRNRIRVLQRRDNDEANQRQAKEYLHKSSPVHALPCAESATGALVLADDEGESAADGENGGCDGEIAKEAVDVVLLDIRLGCRHLGIVVWPDRDVRQ